MRGRELPPSGNGEAVAQQGPSERRGAVSLFVQEFDPGEEPMATLGRKKKSNRYDLCSGRWVIFVNALTAMEAGFRVLQKIQYAKVAVFADSGKLETRLVGIPLWEAEAGCESRTKWTLK